MARPGVHETVLRQTRGVVGAVLVALGGLGVGFAEHRTVGAEHDDLVLIDVFQVVAQPAVHLVRKPVVIRPRSVRVERVVLHDDIVEEDEMQLAQLDRIAGRAEVLLELLHRLAVGRHVLHMIVVADHVEDREIEIRNPGAVGRIKRHVVVNQVAQRNAVNRAVGDRRGRLLQIAAHLLVHVDRMEREVVVTRIARTDLRIGRHQDRIARGRLAAGREREIGPDLRRTLGNTLPELRDAVLHGNLIRRGDGHLHEPPLRKVAVERIVSKLVGQGREQSVAHDHPFDGQPPLVEDRSADGRVRTRPDPSGRVVASAGGQQPPGQEDEYQLS